MSELQDTGETQKEVRPLTGFWQWQIIFVYLYIEIRYVY